METYTQILTSFEGSLGHQQFFSKFEIELPTILGKFVVEELTNSLQLIDIDDKAVHFLRFYPQLQDRLRKCIGDPPEAHLRRIFFEYSKSFVQFWSKSVQDIQKSVNRFKKINLNSALLNRMMVLYLIRQLSNDCERRIRRNLGASKFRLMKESAALVKYLIQRMEVFEWKDIADQHWEQFDKVVYGTFDKKSAQERLQTIFGKPYEDLINSQCFQADEKVNGIYVSDPLNTDMPGYVLRECGERIIITHSTYLKGWKKFEFRFYQKDVSIQLKDSFDGAGSTFITNALTNIGSSLGYLLANMPDRPTKFLKEFFLACTISGSMTVILTSIPILGKLILIGGLGYQAADVLRNADIQTIKKIEKIVGISLSMTVTVGTSLGGAVAGQILIPVPVLGAFIGGMVGGLVGGVSTSAALNKFQTFKVKRMMENMQKHQNPDGSWQVQTALDIYDLKESFLVKHDDRMDRKDQVTLFSYFLLSLFESQREQREIAQLEQGMKDKWYRKNRTPQEVTALKQTIEQLIQDVPEVLLHTEVYMVVHELRLVDHIDVLEKMVEEFLSVL